MGLGFGVALCGCRLLRHTVPGPKSPIPPKISPIPKASHSPKIFLPGLHGETVAIAEALNPKP